VRLIMIVSCSSLCVDRLRVAPQSAEAPISAFLFPSGRSTAYKVPGAVIDGVPATSASPENPAMGLVTTIYVGFAVASSPKYTLIRRAVLEGLMRADSAVGGK
jgi:hypothetical protein